MARPRKEPSRKVCIQIPEVIHDQLKIIAAHTDDTVTRIILQAIRAQIKPLLDKANE